MKGEVEGASVHRKQALCAQLAVRTHGILRAHVDIVPGRIRTIGAELDQAQVEGAEALADDAKMVPFQFRCQRCGNRSPVRLAGYEGRRSRTSLR